MIALGIGLAILLNVIGIVISTLVFWGLGNLIVIVFGISFAWTIWHGLVCALVVAVIRAIFKKN